MGIVPVALAARPRKALCVVSRLNEMWVHRSLSRFLFNFWFVLRGIVREGFGGGGGCRSVYCTSDIPCRTGLAATVWLFCVWCTHNPGRGIIVVHRFYVRVLLC